MKDLPSMFIRIVIVLLLIFSQVGLVSKDGAGDEEYHETILIEIEKVIKDIQR